MNLRGGPFANDLLLPPYAWSPALLVSLTLTTGSRGPCGLSTGWAPNSIADGGLTSQPPRADGRSVW